MHGAPHFLTNHECNPPQSRTVGGLEVWDVRCPPTPVSRSAPEWGATGLGPADRWGRTGAGAAWGTGSCTVWVWVRRYLQLAAASFRPGPCRQLRH